MRGVVGLGSVVAGALCRLLRGCCGGVEGLAFECGASWCFGDVRQTHIVERSTRCGSDALDGEALH